MTPLPLKPARRNRTLALGAALAALAVDTIQIEHKLLVPAVAAGAVVPKDEADRMHASADSLARSHFTGTLLISRLAVFKQAIDDQVGGTATFLDGGVKDVELQSTTVRTATATVKLRATTWMKVSQGNVAAMPTGTADYTFELAKVDGVWLVTSEEFEYLPGQGP
jgi:hypothetical protein